MEQIVQIVQKAARPEPIRPKMPTNFSELLHQKFPEEMEKFDKAPWDYKIFAPCGMDDLPIITIYLYIGRKKWAEEEIVLELPLV